MITLEQPSASSADSFILKIAGNEGHEQVDIINSIPSTQIDCHAATFPPSVWFIAVQ